MTQTNNDHVLLDPIDIMAQTQEKIERRIKAHQRVLLVSRSAYDPNPISVVTLTHAYKRFATGYTYVKVSGVKIPYTLNYVDLLSHSFADTSHWENGDSIYD